MNEDKTDRAVKELIWYLDNVCSRRMTGNIKLFTEVSDY